MGPIGWPELVTLLAGLVAVVAIIWLIRSGRVTFTKGAVALLIGIAVAFLLVAPTRTVSPPLTCYSLFGFVVPCEGWTAWAVAAVTAVVVRLAMWLLDRLRERRGSASG